MKKVLSLAFGLVLCASLAFAQVGSIGLFADTGGTVCNIVEGPVGVPTTIFAVHVLTGGAIASEWAAPVPACYGGTYMNDTAVFGVTIGNSQTGVEIGYGMCLVGPIHVLTLNLQNQANTPACCLWRVVPHPVNGLNMVTCPPQSLRMPATGGAAIFNPDSSCQCDVATRESTWGAIKNMYN